MLKKISVLLTVGILMVNVIQAQTTVMTTDTAAKTMRTIWGSIAPKVNTLGLYVAPEIQYFGAAGAYAPAVGISGMLLINQKLAVGVTAAHSRNFTPTDLNNAGLRMNYRYAGAQFEYTIAAHRLLHVSIPLMIGAGMARVDSLQNGRQRGELQHPIGTEPRGLNHSNSFFVIQPGLRLETNLSRFAKLYAGVNYRVVPGSTSVSYPVGTSTGTLSNSQLSGLSFNVGLNLGWFDYKLKG